MLQSHKSKEFVPDCGVYLSSGYTLEYLSCQHMTIISQLNVSCVLLIGAFDLPDLHGIIGYSINSNENEFFNLLIVYLDTPSAYFGMNDHNIAFISFQTVLWKWFLDSCAFTDVNISENPVLVYKHVAPLLLSSA